MTPLPPPPHYSIFKNSFIDFLFICNISSICANLGLWITSFDICENALNVLQTSYDAIFNVQSVICNMQNAIFNMQCAIFNMQCAICFYHNIICNNLYGLADGNMLYTIYNVQYFSIITWSFGNSVLSFCKHGNYFL